MSMGGGSMGGGLAGMFSSWWLEPHDPQYRDPGVEMSYAIKAQRNLLPYVQDLQESENIGAPAQTRLGMRMYEQALLGKEGSPGLISLYEQVAPRAQAVDLKLAQEAARATREQTVRDLQDLGPGVRTATEAYNPEALGLLRKLTGAAETDLAAGSTLNPDQRLAAQRNLSAAWSRRGLEGSPTGAMQEAVILSQAGDAMRQQRLKNAEAAMVANEQFYGDPFSKIFGVAPPNTQSGGGLLTAAAGLRERNPAINMTDPYLERLHAQNEEAKLLGYTTNAAWKAGAVGSASQFGSGLGGTMGSGIGAGKWGG